MAIDISQYFDVKISSPKGADKQVSIHATKYIEVGAKLVDEDGLIKEFIFDMKDGFLMMDVLSIGMRVDLEGGDLDRKEYLFSGFIKDITPSFEETGDIKLTIKAYSEEGGRLGVGIRDLIYPSKNHSKTWATKELTYSDIIVNLAKDTGIRVKSENIKVNTDIKAGFAVGTIRQKSMTDWAFMQMLADKIHCTLWTEEKNGTPELYLVDDSLLVNKLANYTFFFLARKSDNEFMDFTKTSDKQVQILKAKIKLDTQNVKGSYSVITDPSTGETKVTTEQENEKGEMERWVLDEEKVEGLSYEERNDLIQLFMSGKITWEGENKTTAAKTYFKKVIIGEGSRKGVRSNTVVEASNPDGGDVGEDGINGSNSTTKNTGSTAYKTVIDEEKLRKLTPEQRSGIMGRIARGEITEDDKQYYTVVDSTAKNNTDDASTTGQGEDTDAGQSLGVGSPVASTKRKRDEGFTITCGIYGNLEIVPRKSYVLEGLGKYSGSYYLYKVTHEWGKKGYLMELVFTK